MNVVTGSCVSAAPAGRETLVQWVSFCRLCCVFVSSSVSPIVTAISVEAEDANAASATS